MSGGLSEDIYLVEALKGGVGWIGAIFKGGIGGGGELPMLCGDYYTIITYAHNLIICIKKLLSKGSTLHKKYKS